MNTQFTTFADMEQVVAHVKAGKPLYYQGTLDYRPYIVDARPFGKVRIYIRGCGHDRDYDSFTADAKHLDRFRRQA